MSGNKFIELTSEDGQRTYKLLFSTNALALVEEKMEVKMTELQTKLATMGIAEIRIMFWAALEGARIRLHMSGAAPRTSPYTLIEAAEILDDVGGVRTAATAIHGAMRKAFNIEDAEAATGKEGELENPM